MDSNLARALERLEKNASEQTRRGLELAAKIQEVSEELEKKYAVQLADLSEEAQKRIRSDKTTVLEETPAVIARGAFLETAEKIFSVVLSGAGESLPEKDKAALASLSWGSLVTDEAAEKAGRAPEEFFEALADCAEKEGCSEEMLSRFVLPVAALALRVFIGKAAKAAAAFLDRDALEERPFPFRRHCPVCGGDAVFARVSETVSNGSVRHLTCGVCSASWLWNRIGCPSCGTNVTADLKYLHDEKDTSHRLYVCAHCGDILPTVFEAEGAEASAPDELERVVLADLEAAYRACKS